MRTLVLAVLGLLASGAILPARALSFDRDVLWKIVSNCIADEPGADYCRRCPSPLLPRLADCADASDWDSAAICRKTTEVWAKSADYVAIRDLKMCGCPTGFVHGLALPRQKVTGVEDPAKSLGIWRFAWDEALAKIGAAQSDSILLAVNPPAARSQDQLHIHLLRLSEGARQRILDLHPVSVKALDDVWAAAARHAAAAGLAEGGYGVAVIYDPAADAFLIATSAGNLERPFSLFSCRGVRG